MTATIGTQDLNDVGVLVAVVEGGSFSAAAKRLGVPKSSVSRRVSRLEDSLGVRLLQRTTRTLNLTDAGRVYYEHCVRGLAQLEEGAHRVNQLQGAPRGVLKISAPNDLGAGLVGDLLSRYRERYPEVNVIVDLTTRYVDLVAEGYDLALRSGTLPDSSLIARKLMQFEFQLYASEEYCARRGEPRKPEDLTQHECLCRGLERREQTWELKGKRSTHRVAVSGPVASNDLGFLHTLMLQGMGIASLPVPLGSDYWSSRIWRRGYSEGVAVRRILEAFSGQESVLYAVYPSANKLAPKVQRFVELAQGCTPEECVD